MTPETPTWIALCGVIGLGAMTWLCPLTAAILARVLRTVSSSAERTGPPRTIDILIPAHDEALVIGSTLKRIIENIRLAKTLHPDLQCRVLIGADSCRDDTALIARQLAQKTGQETEVLEVQFQNKWKTLNALLLHSNAEWIAFVDADIEWEDPFLSSLLALPWKSDWIGVAPAFGEAGQWRFEKHLKSIENLSGGPTSVHGATVFYRRGRLMSVLDNSRQNFKGENWANDDVVIPLVLRATFVRERIFYWIPAGRSLLRELDRNAPPTARQELNRRIRMAQGNLTIARKLLPGIFIRNPVAGILGMRRIFRVFWAYWLLLCSAAVLPFVPPTLSFAARATAVLAFSLGALAALRPRFLKHAFCATIASVLAPGLWIQKSAAGKVRWK